IVRSPVEICLGTSPSQAAKSRPLDNASPTPIAATIALEMIGPIPGTLISRSQPASRRAMASISPDKSSMRSSSRRQSPASQVLDDVHHAWRQDIGGRGQDARQLGAQEALPLPYGDAALQQEGADLIDDASTLAHQPLTNAMQRLQVEIGGLRRSTLARLS